MINVENMNEKIIKQYIKATTKKTDTDFSGLLIAIILFPLLFIGIPLIGHPFYFFHLFFFIPFIILDVWVLVYKFRSKLRHPKKPDLQFYLIRGVFGLFVSPGCFLVAQKFAYTMLPLNTPWFFILTFLGYLLALFLHIKSSVDTLTKTPNKRKKQNKGQRVDVIASSVALGSFVYSVFFRDVSGSITAIFMIIIWLFFSVLLMHFIIELHKYMIAKAYIKKEKTV